MFLKEVTHKFDNGLLVHSTATVYRICEMITLNNKKIVPVLAKDAATLEDALNFAKRARKKHPRIPIRIYKVITITEII